jgi:hypothetical protein
LLGLSDNSESKPNSVIVILRDESPLPFHIKEAQEAKTESEELLSTILPKDIVAKLNQCEADISFSVPSVLLFH